MDVDFKKIKEVTSMADLNKLKDFATAVVNGDTFDLADIAALQNVDQLPSNVDPEQLLNTIAESKDQIVAGDFSALSGLMSSLPATKPSPEVSDDKSPESMTTESAEDVLLTNTIGSEMNSASDKDDTDDTLANDVPATVNGDPRPTFKDVFGVGIGTAWDLAEVKFFDKVLNKNANILTDAKVKLGAILDGASENGTLEINLKTVPTDSDLVEMFKVNLRFITIKENYYLFYVSGDRQLIGECVGSTLYLF